MRDSHWLWTFGTVAVCVVVGVTVDNGAVAAACLVAGATALAIGLLQTACQLRGVEPTTAMQAATMGVTVSVAASWDHGRFDWPALAAGLLGATGATLIIWMLSAPPAYDRRRQR